MTICEDIWHFDDCGQPRYPVDPVAELVAAGADCILNLSASPFDIGKPLRRLELVRAIALAHGVPVAYCNLVGGTDSHPSAPAWPVTPSIPIQADSERPLLAKLVSSLGKFTPNWVIVWAVELIINSHFF